MKKIFTNLILLLILLLVTTIIILSTIGIETDKFNKLISNKISKTKNIDLKLETIKFRLDLEELSLFLETKRPQINYKNLSIPVQNIKVYIDFLSLLKSDPKFRKVNINLKELDINQLNKLSIILKPSNFKSLLNNKIKEGTLISEIEVYLNEKTQVKNFISRGEIKNLKVELIDDLNLVNTNLSFFADKNDILIKNVHGNIDNIKISDGDIKLNLENGIKISSNFNSKIDLDYKFFEKKEKLLNKLNFKKIENLQANLINNFSIVLDNTYKVKDYNYNFSGKFEKLKIKLPKIFKIDLNNINIDKIYFSDLKVLADFKPKKIKFNGGGEYSLDNKDFLRINFDNEIEKKILNLKLDFDYKNDFNLDLINYQKPKNTLANIFLNIQKKEKNIKINKLNYTEKKNLIVLEDLIFKEKNFVSFKKILVNTNNNNFEINKRKKIIVVGDNFDASKVPKFLNNQNNQNYLRKISNLIEIDFKNINAPLSEKLKNFKLIGEIKNGKFVKISSKGDFGNNNFLDISMKKDKKSNKKYLEIYSDLTKPLLTEYSFFNGLSGGKLLFTSIIDNTTSISKLKIENFKVKNAPGIIKLLSLADLGGLADLAKGEGLSFEILEIDMEKNKDGLKLKEILALGPSMSVLVEGYQDKTGLTSLRGTLVPAKTLNSCYW